MLTLKEGKVVPDGNKTQHPFDIAARSTELLPAGCVISTSIFVVDKLDFVFCDGEDHWYREADKPVASGQPISALF